MVNLSFLPSNLNDSTAVSFGRSSVCRQIVLCVFTLRDFRRTFVTIRYTMKTIWTIYDERTTYIAKNAIFKLKIFNISNLFHVVSPLWGLIVD